MPVPTNFDEMIDIHLGIDYRNYDKFDISQPVQPLTLPRAQFMNVIGLIQRCCVGRLSFEYQRLM